ncbi:4357_t:CDS:2 [Scutellospora calospora]|uniref:4357_t:CDS:1 n=1 Tax=Scutellospora calospora TaxID=85575 RepID=A0ACA9JXX1_9GLOM|nr:4357_t:CDS:2 [Scutellospora calospora]
MLCNGATPLEVFKYNKDKVLYSNSYPNMGKIYKDLENEKIEKRGGRFWRPVTIYIYGPGGCGKTSFVKKLFGKELYDKPEKGRGTNWWNGYKGQEFILLDEFYTKIDWGNMVNLLNDEPITVQVKHGFVPIIAKYIILTSTRPPIEAYNFKPKDNSDDDWNKRDFRQFARRLDYVIEFTVGCWDDNIEKRTTDISFKTTDVEGANWRSEKEFRSMEWPVKYNNDEYDIDEIVEMGEMFTEGIEDAPSGKTRKCYELFDSKYISHNTEKIFLRPKYLKEYGKKVINHMIHPKFTKIPKSYFNKFDSRYIKFVYLETVFSMDYFKKNVINENVDYIIKFNRRYDENGKIISGENKRDYEFERGDENSLKELIRKEFSNE